MGCLCPKSKLKKFIKELNEKLNEEPAPIEKEDKDSKALKDKLNEKE